MTPAVVCFGELLLRLSAPGYERMLQSPNLEVFFGGAEANAAAALCAFGTPASVVTALPDNSIGAAVLANLRSQGIDTRHVLFGPGRMGLYFHTQGAMQRPSEVVYDRANSVFAQSEPDAFDWKRILAEAKWLHVSGITAAVSEQGAQSTLRALQMAQRIGVQT
jgi:2-dehydro-3-deoxygluconokinase